MTFKFDTKKSQGTLKDIIGLIYFRYRLMVSAKSYEVTLFLTFF